MAGHGMRMFVAGGSGFIGSNICRESVRRGFKVVSVSRTGRPEHIKEPWVDCVEWVKADIRDQPAYLEQLRKADTVFSCIGKFGLGNNSDVYETNADLNIQLAHLVKNECEGLKKYGYISAQQYSARVQAPFRSYFQSKLKAEYMIQTLFPKNYLVFRPNWVFGWRHVYGPLWLPTQLIGQPIEHFLNPIADYAENTKCVVPPLPVTELAHTAVLGMTLGRDISGTMPTKRVRDVIEREAQGRPLDDYLLPYQRQENEDYRAYLEETNYAEKYGLRGYGKKNREETLMRKKKLLNNAWYRPEFTHPTKSIQYLVDRDITPTYRIVMLEKRKQEYLEGRRVQQLFEKKTKQELLDGERRLLGETVPPCDIFLPGYQFERDPLVPAREVWRQHEKPAHTHTQAVPDTRRLSAKYSKLGPNEHDWDREKEDDRMPVGYVGVGSGGRSMS